MVIYGGDGVDDTRLFQRNLVDKIKSKGPTTVICHHWWLFRFGEARESLSAIERDLSGSAKHFGAQREIVTRSRKRVHARPVFARVSRPDPVTSAPAGANGRPRRTRRNRAERRSQELDGYLHLISHRRIRVLPTTPNEGTKRCRSRNESPGIGNWQNLGCKQMARNPKPVNGGDGQAGSRRGSVSGLSPALEDVKVTIAVGRPTRGLIIDTRRVGATLSAFCDKSGVTSMRCASPERCKCNIVLQRQSRKRRQPPAHV